MRARTGTESVWQNGQLCQMQRARGKWPARFRRPGHTVGWDQCWNDPEYGARLLHPVDQGPHWPGAPMVERSRNRSEGEQPLLSQGWEYAAEGIALKPRRDAERS